MAGSFGCAQDRLFGYAACDDTADSFAQDDSGIEISS
jgi:hypothetical protein